MRPPKRASKAKVAESYQHPEADMPMRPEVGTQAQFKKKKPPQTYRYDSSLSPVLEWDGNNPAREKGEQVIKEIGNGLKKIGEAFEKEALQTLDGDSAKNPVRKAIQQTQQSLEKLKALGKPFLNWSGKAERLSFDVPTLPLFIHERLSTKAIIATLKGHKSDKQEDFFRELWNDPQHSVTDQVLRAYEYRDDWVNRMMLGDSLVAMNSLLRYESLGGQVQMIYIDPPYGVKFGSNFQPFVRKRDVGHNDDEDMTREPEMVQAYRDTWELGLHSYLTYLRDRLLLARELLHPSGSIFVQISDENLHHVREVMDEVFGAENFVSVITFQKTTSASGERLPAVSDYLVWYARDTTRMKSRQLYLERLGEGWVNYNYVRLPDGTHRRMNSDESADWSHLPEGARVYRRDNLTSQRPAQEGDVRSYKFQGRDYTPGKGTFKTDLTGLQQLEKAERLEAYGSTLSYRRFAKDFPYLPLNNLWDDTSTGGYAEERFYVVQTITKVIQRCMLMTTDPGDLVLDPTCGSGTTAYVAEQWGRRWITCDTSRVPLALARQRLLTATFSYYDLKDEERGPAGGFVYQRKQNKKSEETGGIVPHVTLKSIANNEPPGEEVLVDRPEVKSGIIRVTGPFVFEATIPTPVDWEGDGKEDSGTLSSEDYGAFVDRMLEVLRKSPVLRLEGNRTVQLKNIRPPAKSLSLSAEAIVEALAEGQKATLEDLVADVEEKARQALPLSHRPVAIVFGPENGAVSEKLVYEAAREAHAKNYTHLYVMGFAIQPNARELVEKCNDVMGVPATYVQATPDLMMGDLLKNMRSSQIFSVCGLPELKVHRKDVETPKKAFPKAGETGPQYQVELLGLDVFDPISMEVDHQSGNDVPAWLLDTDYNGLCFHVSQAFFPRTGAWENLKKALKGDYDEAVWDHLAGTISAPFAAGEHGQIAVKVIDQRGNELLVVKRLKEAGK